MNLIDYGRILLRRGWIILLLALIAAGSAYFLTSRQTPQYRAAQVVLIQPARTDNGLTLAIIQLMNSYQVYLKSSPSRRRKSSTHSSSICWRTICSQRSILSPTAITSPSKSM